MGNWECRRRRVPGPRFCNMMKDIEARSIDRAIQRIEVDRPKVTRETKTDIQYRSKPPKGKPQIGSFFPMNTNQLRGPQLVQCQFIRRYATYPRNETRAVPASGRDQAICHHTRHRWPPTGLPRLTRARVGRRPSKTGDVQGGSTRDHKGLLKAGGRPRSFERSGQGGRVMLRRGARASRQSGRGGASATRGVWAGTADAGGRRGAPRDARSGPSGSGVWPAPGAQTGAAQGGQTHRVGILADAVGAT